MQVRTQCKGCVFATGNKNKQDGCSLDRLDKLKRYGAKLNLVTEKNGNTYWEIDNRFCSAYRTQEWANAQHGELTEVIKDDLKLSLEVVIVVDEQTEEEVIRTIDSILTDSWGVKNIAIANNTGKESLKVVVNKLRSSGLNSWRIENIPFTLYKNRTEAVDLVLCNNKRYSQFFLLILAGHILTPGFINNLDHRLNHECEPILASGDGICTLSMVDIYKAVGGNKGLTFVEKLKKFAEEETFYKVELSDELPIAFSNSDNSQL